MSKSVLLTENELSEIRTIVQKLYPKLKIVDIAAEIRQKHPAVEGLDLTDVGLALLLETGKVDIYYKIITGELGCYIDTFLFPLHIDLSWYIVVTIFENDDKV